MQVFRQDEAYQTASRVYKHDDDYDDDMEVELVAEPAIGSAASYRGRNQTNSADMMGDLREDDEAKMLDGNELLGGPPLLDRSRFTGRVKKRWAWMAVAVAGATIFLIVVITALKLKGFSGRLTSAPSSPCTFSGVLIPDALAAPLQYNLTLALTWDHFLSVPGRIPPSTFQAASVATLQMRRSATCLVLHSQGLQYKQIDLRVNGGNTKCLCGTDSGCPDTSCLNIITAAPVSSKVASSDGMSIVHLQQEVKAGDVISLSTIYTGLLGTRETALHRSWGFPYGSETAHLISTQFKESHARQVLPCLDEPQYRARFTLAVELPKPMTALSTMPIVSTRTPSTLHGLKLVTFEESPPMATHMLSFCGGRLRGRTITASSNINITAWGPPALEDLGEVVLSLDIARSAYDYFARYTGVELPLKKIDMVTVPGRKQAEPHWGLIMFDERSFLFNAASEGTYDVFLAANSVCHNMALQWFGGYVTPASWANYVIADGVAGLLSYGCLQDSQPLMNARALFLLATTPMGQAVGPHEGPQMQALQLAGDPLVPPLVPSDGLSPPPALATAQGAALLGMLEVYCDNTTPGAFQAGLQLFLQRHALSNATMVQLAEAIVESLLTRGIKATTPPPLCLPTCLQSDQSGVATKDAIQRATALITPYFHVAGYPAVFSEGDAKKHNTIRFQQSAFCAWMPPSASSAAAAAARAGGSTHGSQEWLPLPVSQMSSKEADGVEVLQFVELSRQTGNVILPDDNRTAIDSNSWVVKSGGRGLYRGTYDDSQMAALARTLRGIRVEASPDGEITDASLNRLLSASALLDDCFAELLSANAYKWTAAFALFEAAAASPAARTGFGQYLLLLPITKGLKQLRQRLRVNRACLNSLDSYTVMLLGPPASVILQLGSHGRTTQDKVLSNLAKSDILVGAALSGHINTARQLCAMFDDPNFTLHLRNGRLYGGIPIDVRGAAYIAAVANPPGCQLKDATRVLREEEIQWKQRVDEREDLRYLFSLPYASDVDSLTEVLQVAMHVNSTVSKVAQPEDAQQVLRLVAANDVGGDAAWRFLSNNWQDLLTSQGPLLYETLTELALPATRSQLVQLRSFFAKNGAGQAASQIVKDRSIGRLTSEIKWISEHSQGVCSYLQKAAAVKGR